MAFGWRVAIRLAVGVAAVALAGPIARADPVLVRTEDAAAAARLVLFGSVDGGRDKTHASAGFKQAILGSELDSSGFRMMGKLGGSQEPGSRRPRRGTLWTGEAQLLLGYEWRIGDSFIALYAGSDSEANYYRDALVAGYRLRFAPRIHADLWLRPSERALIQASAYVSALDSRAWGRLAGGWSIVPDLYLGPEIEIYRQSDYSKLRLGGHLTGLAWLGANWRVSAGWESSRITPAGPYAVLSLYWRR